MQYIILEGLAFILSVVFLLFWYHRRIHTHIPSLYYKENDFMHFVVNKISRLHKPFLSSFWLQNPHIHTIYASVRPQKRIPFDRQHFFLKDEGLLGLDWVKNDSIPDSNPVVVVIPGLTGDASGVSNLCDLLSGRHYRAVVFNKRGHGDTVLITPKMQGFGDPSDLRQVIEYISEKYERARICAIGMSAGSGLIASYLGEYGHNSLLTCAVCICPSFDTVGLFLGRTGMSTFYHKLLLSKQKKLLKKHVNILSEMINVDAAMKAKTFTDFDRHVYCRFYGHNNPYKYWKHNNPLKKAYNIAIPVMCICSLDDPVCGEDIPLQLFLKKDDVLLVTVKNGGHCGFLEGLRSISWADHVSAEFVDTVLEFNKQPI